MSLLTALVGVNYMAICKHYRMRRPFTRVCGTGRDCSIVGAFLLIAITS